MRPWRLSSRCRCGGRGRGILSPHNTISGEPEVGSTADGSIMIKTILPARSISTRLTSQPAATTALTALVVWLVGVHRVAFKGEAANRR